MNAILFLQISSITSDFRYALSGIKAITLILAAILMLLGGLKLYNEWQMKGGQDIEHKIVIGYFGGAIFFIIARVALGLIIRT